MKAMNICEQAEAFRLLLLMGVIDKSEIIAWADRMIETQDSVPGWLLDVSLAANESVSVIETKLRELPGEWNRTTAAYAAMNRFAIEFQVHDKYTSQQAAKMLWVWAGSPKVSSEDYPAAMAPKSFADEVAYGYASDRDVVASIDACIEHFRRVQNKKPTA